MKTKECKYKDHVGDRQLPITEFRKQTAAKDGLSSQCKICANQISERWRKNNFERKRMKQKERLATNLLEFRQWKQEQGCYFCYEDEPCCLELHHLDPSQKERNLSDVVTQGWAKERWIKEAEKCIVVCSNCHKKVHENIISP